MLGLATKAGKCVSGEFSVEQTIKNKSAVLVIVAADASSNTKKHFCDMCAYRNIPIIFTGDRNLLGKCTGKQERVSVSVLDQGFANKLLSMEREVEV